MDLSDLTSAHLQRINVVGTSGIGKTTFARELATALDYPYIELDGLYWGPNWTEVDADIFNIRLTDATTPQKWVMDGNYSRINDVKRERVTAIVWLDFRFSRNLRQAVGRAVNRAWTKKELWPGTGNRESFRKLLFSHNSILLWTLQTHHSNRRRYLGLMEDPDWAHIKFIQLRNPGQADSFIHFAKELTELERR